MTRIFLLLALFVLIDARRGGGGGGRRMGSRWRSSKVKDMKDELEERVDKLYEKGCPGNRVHFFFHGDDADHEHGHHNDQQVHVFMHQEGHGGGHQHNHPPAAHCQFDTDSIHGHVHIEPADDERTSEFKVIFDSLGPAHTNYTMHVHELGDLTNGCDGLGGHYDPNQDDDVDSGDMGTFRTNADGGVDEVDLIMDLTLHWHSTVLGRSIIVHDADTGDKITCCVIGLAVGDEHNHGHVSSEGHVYGHYGHRAHHGHYSYGGHHGHHNPDGHHGYSGHHGQHGHHGHDSFHGHYGHHGQGGRHQHSGHHGHNENSHGQDHI